MKSTALLLVAGYLLLGLSALAAGSCPREAGPFPAELVPTAGCFGENAMPAPANAHPCGACLDHCEPGSHSAHLGSSPAVKRLNPDQPAAATSPVSSGVLAARHAGPPGRRQTRLPNPVLAALRTVVLLN